MCRSVTVCFLLGFMGTASALSEVGVESGPEIKLGFTAIEIDPNNSDTIYGGGNLRNLFKSTDGGSSWTPIWTEEVGTVTHEVSQVVVDPHRPNTVYVAIDNHGNGSEGGLFKSTDGGASWTARNSGLSTDWIEQLVADPQVPDLLYARAHFRLYRTTDGADSWELLLDENIGDISLFPRDSQILYATWYDSAQQVKLLGSMDRGDSWQEISDVIFGDIEVDPQDPQILYLAGETRSGDSVTGWLRRSQDSGRTWTEIFTFLGGGFWFARVDPIDPGILFVGGGNKFDEPSLWRSTDNGQNWTLIRAEIPRDLTVNPVDHSTVYLAAGSGFWTFHLTETPTVTRSATWASVKSAFRE